MIPLFFLIGMIISRIHIQKFPVVSVILICLLMCYPVARLLISDRAEERHFIKCVDYETFDMKEYQLSDYTIYIPSEGNSNGYYEFPVVMNEETAEKIELRGITLREGFRAIEH